ncbi:MAG: hypothetical protein IPI02_21605 [Sterolibacteriaceae bacterium]|nr:hypothetical protein [Sterolibacteriaceae bacterium]
MKALAWAGPLTTLTLTGVSLRPPSLAITLAAPPTRAVAVPPSATLMASALATGVVSLTGLIVMLTVAVLVWPSLSVSR